MAPVLIKNVLNISFYTISLNEFYSTNFYFQVSRFFYLNENEILAKH